MKKLVMIMVMAVMAFGAQAQNDAISKYFAKYEKDTEKFSAVSFSGKMFAMINSIQVEDDEDRALVESLGKIKGVKVLFAQKNVDGAAMYKEVMGAMKGNKIDELFMVMGGTNEFGMISIVGDGIDINQLYRLSKNLGMDEFKHLGGK